MSRFFKVLGFFLVIAFVQPVLTYAQSPQDPGSRFLDEREREHNRSRLENARPGQKIEVTQPKKVEREAICFPVNAIRLRGVSVIDAKKLSTIIDSYKDTCMGQSAIGALIELINKTYVEAGFITTRAYVPQQDLNSGELLINVVEGRIEGFVYRVVDKNGEIEAGKPRKIRSAFPIKPGDVFQLRKIEQGLDQINRLASSQATIDLLPGSKPGTSLVVVTEAKVDRYRVNVSYDNRGGESTGVNRYRGSLDIDDIFGLNEAYSLSYLGTTNTNVVAYNYSIPYGYWTLSSSGSYSESLDSLSAVSALFNQTSNVSVQLERLLSRGAEQKTWGYMNAGYFTNSRFINIEQLTPQDRTALSVGLRTERYLKNGVFSADLGYIRGVPFFGADSDPDIIAFDQPRAEFDKFDTVFSYLHRFENGYRFNTSLIGQWTDDVLFSNQQLTIGGWDSVRGFQGDESTGDRGFLMRNEFSFIFPEIKFDDEADKSLKPNYLAKFYNKNIRAFQPYMFVDAGQVENLALQDRFEMVGAGLGIRGGFGRISVDAALAFPLTNSNFTQPGDVQGLINVSTKLF